MIDKNQLVWSIYHQKAVKEDIDHLMKVSGFDNTYVRYSHWHNSQKRGSISVEENPDQGRISGEFPISILGILFPYLQIWHLV